MEKDNLELPVLKGKNREKAIPFAFIIGIIAMLIIFLIACLSLTVKGEYKLHFSDKGNMDYKVYLKKNEFFEDDYLPMDRQYIASIIDHVDADFSYSFKSDERINLEYSYYLTATLLINNADGKKIYDKKETILEKQKYNEVKNDSFSISENVKIDYDKYNKVATKFVEQYGIVADSKLVVSLYVDVVGKHAEFDKNISDKAVVTLEIPLTNKTVDITLDYELAENNNQILQYSSTRISNPILFGFACVLAVADIVAIIGFIIYVIINRDNETLYNIKLNKILKDYDRYISETKITERVEDLLKTRGLRIVILNSFESLMDVRDTIEKPILFHEERIGEEAIFYLFDDKIGYVYVMRASDMSKERKK